MYDYPSHRLHCPPVSSVTVTLDGVASDRHDVRSLTGHLMTRH